jgi:hypothetical protein
VTPSSLAANSNAAPSNIDQWKWCEQPSSMLTKIWLSHRINTPSNIPQRVKRQCWDIASPGSRYSRIDRHKKPQRGCGLHGARTIQKESCRNSQQPAALRTRLVNMNVQEYMVQSRVCMKEWILKDRILNNILRSSSVFSES